MEEVWRTWGVGEVMQLVEVECSEAETVDSLKGLVEGEGEERQLLVEVEAKTMELEGCQYLEGEGVAGCLGAVYLMKQEALGWAEGVGEFVQAELAWRQVAAVELQVDSKLEEGKKAEGVKMLGAAGLAGRMTQWLMDMGMVGNIYWAGQVGLAAVERWGSGCP